jgi:hypothetical protein
VSKRLHHLAEALEEGGVEGCNLRHLLHCSLILVQSSIHGIL